MCVPPFFFCVVGGSEQEFDKAQELGLPKLVMVRGTDNSKREEREARFLERVVVDYWCE